MILDGEENTDLLQRIFIIKLQFKNKKAPK